jgi:hypothetical protein
MKLKGNYIWWITGGIVLVAGLYILLRKLTPFKKYVVENANKEWAKFGYQTRDKEGNWIREGHKEYEEGFWQRVGDYWRQAVNRNRDGKDRDMAWSSAFISWIFLKSGGLFRIPFKTSSSHSSYIREYVQNRKKGKTNAPFVAYRIYEKSAEVGDLVCYSREDEADLYDETGRYKSHCDIVVAKRPNEIEVIGGNVNQSVSKKVLKTMAGRVIDDNNDWFAIIKNNA